MEREGRTIRTKSHDVYRPWRKSVAASRRILTKKLIRAAHAKEKQLLKNSCHRPNRLNLLDSTVCSRARSKFFTKNSCVVGFSRFQGPTGDRRDPNTDLLCTGFWRFYRRFGCSRFVALAASSRTS